MQSPGRRSAQQLQPPEKTATCGMCCNQRPEGRRCRKMLQGMYLHAEHQNQRDGSICANPAVLENFQTSSWRSSSQTIRAIGQTILVQPSREHDRTAKSKRRGNARRKKLRRQKKRRARNQTNHCANHRKHPPTSCLGPRVGASTKGRKRGKRQNRQKRPRTPKIAKKSPRCEVPVAEPHMFSAFRSFRSPRQRNSASPRPTDSRTPVGELRTSTDQNAPVFDKRHCCATTPRWSRVRRFFRAPEPKSDPLDAPNDALSTRWRDSASNATRLVPSFPRSGCPARSAHSILRGNGTPHHVRPIRGRLRANSGLPPTRMRQCSIKGIVAQQLLVGSASDDSSALQNQNPIRSTHQRCAIDKTVRFRIECDKACPIISSFRLSSAFRSFRPPRQRNSASPRPTDSRTPAGELRTSTDPNAPVFDKRHCCATIPRWFSRPTILPRSRTKIRSARRTQRCAIDKTVRFRIECDKACPIISSFRLSSAFRSFRPPRQRNSASPRPTDSKTPAGELRTSTDQNAPVFDKRHCCATTPRWFRVRRFFRAPEPKSDPLDAPTMRYRQGGAIPHRMRQGLSYHFLVPAVQRVPLIPSSAATELRTTSDRFEDACGRTPDFPRPECASVR